MQQKKKLNKHLFGGVNSVDDEEQMKVLNKCSNAETPSDIRMGMFSKILK